MSEHHSGEDDQVFEDANFSLADVEVFIVREGARPDLPQIAGLVVDLACAVYVDEVIVEQGLQAVCIVCARQFDTPTFKRADSVEFRDVYICCEH